MIVFGWTSCACQVDLSPSPPAPLQITWQVTACKSTCQVHLRGDPPKITPASCSKNPPWGELRGGVRSRSWPKKKVKIDRFLIFPVKMMFLEIFLDPTLDSEKDFWKRVLFLNLSWNLADFRRVQISWIPGTYTLPKINNFTETFCDVDDWIFHSLSLCLSPMFCVLPVSLRDCLYREKNVEGG